MRGPLCTLIVSEVFSATLHSLFPLGESFAWELLSVPGQPGLQGETLAQKRKAEPNKPRVEFLLKALTTGHSKWHKEAIRGNGQASLHRGDSFTATSAQTHPSAYRNGVLSFPIQRNHFFLNVVSGGLWKWGQPRLHTYQDLCIRNKKQLASRVNNQQSQR